MARGPWHRPWHSGLAPQRTSLTAGTFQALLGHRHSLSAKPSMITAPPHTSSTSWLYVQHSTYFSTFRPLPTLFSLPGMFSGCQHQAQVIKSRKS